MYANVMGASWLWSTPSLCHSWHPFSPCSQERTSDAPFFLTPLNPPRFFRSKQNHLFFFSPFAKYWSTVVVCAKLCVAGWLCKREPSGGMFLCVGYWRARIRSGTICTRPCLGVFPPTNCSTHQFHSNEYIPLQAAFFFQLCSGHLLCLESQASLPGKLLLTLQSPVHPLRRSSHLQLPSTDLSFPLRPPHFLHSWNEAALMLLVHLSGVFEARDCIRSQVYVYIPIRRLLMRVFQDVN